MSYQDLLPLIFTEIVGDFGFKEFANYGGITNFTVGLSGYVGVIYYLIRSLQGSNILLVNAVWDALSAIIESIAAIIILGERFDDPCKYLGIILIFAGLYFLKMPLFRKHTFKFPTLIKESFVKHYHKL
jgi:multidrug transporter EmrE-like cation transporter